MQINCATCNKEFEKDAREHKRQLKAGRNKFFCSRKCAAIKNNEENPRKGNVALLNSSNRRDEYTPFRWFILRAQYRDKNKKRNSDLTVEYLKGLWEGQQGICLLTGWLLTLPYDVDGCLTHDPANASIDRIDSAKGYEQGNVRFISVMANYARNSFSDIQLIDFCKAVTINNK